VSHSTILGLERATHDPTTEATARVAAALGLDLSVRLYPGTGPLIRDHLQAPMLDVLIDGLDERWRPTPEVAVHRPVRGVIDLVLESDQPPLIACEAQSELRRLEQQLRWARAKADALSQARGQAVSLLLLLRSTRRTRAIVAEYSALMQAAYPASAADAYASLTGDAAWPGDALLWCTVEQGRARVLAQPPRNVVVGR